MDMIWCRNLSTWKRTWTTQPTVKASCIKASGVHRCGMQVRMPWGCTRKGQYRHDRVIGLMPGASKLSYSVMAQGHSGEKMHKQFYAWFKGVDKGVWDVCSTVKSKGGTAWLIGGCVRDALLGGNPKEIDLATNMRPSQIMDIFGASAEPTGLNFGTITVKSHGSKYEITSLRREGEYTDGRRPEQVEFTDSLHEDLRRRDFTINAIAFDPMEDELIDPFGGIQDLESGYLRVVGGNASFRLAEDGLRVWRAYRFMDNAGRGLRTFDSELEEALTCEQVQLSAAKVSRERIWQELEKLLRGRYADSILHEMSSHNMLQVAFQLDRTFTTKDDGIIAQKYLVPCRRRLQGLSLSTQTPTTSYIVLDMEATCDLKAMNQPQEVIQLSAILCTLNEKNGQLDVQSEFDAYCKPTINSKLSEFCTSFTGISQKDVDRAKVLEDVLDDFQHWLTDHNLLNLKGELVPCTEIFVCGDWDLKALLPKQCAALNLSVPAYFHSWSNVQNLYSSYYWTAQTSLKNMAAAFGFEMEGDYHNALNDAKLLSKIMEGMFRDGCKVLPAQSGDIEDECKLFMRQMQDVSLARTCLLLAGLGQDEVLQSTASMKLGRYARGIISKSCSLLSKFPKLDNMSEMRLYKHFAGDELAFQLCIECALACAKYGWESPQHIEVEETASQLLSIGGKSSPLIDGAWIMSHTGLEKGQRLGRLKEWLWRLQIEQSITTVDEMEKLLNEINWRDSDHLSWPRMHW